MFVKCMCSEGIVLLLISLGKHLETDLERNYINFQHAKDKL